MVSMLPLNVVDQGFEPRSDQTEDYEIDICCFSAIKPAALRNKREHTNHYTTDPVYYYLMTESFDLILQSASQKM
jgi:hypothetical protein